MRLVDEPLGNVIRFCERAKILILFTSLTPACPEGKTRSAGVVSPRVWMRESIKPGERYISNVAPSGLIAFSQSLPVTYVTGMNVSASGLDAAP